MRVLLRRAVFSVGEAEFSWGDVALAASLWGEWPEVVERARAGLVLLERSEEEDGDPLPESDVQAAADEFRYDRDLVAADETEAWLARWDLDVERWMRWVRGDLLRSRTEDEVETDAEPTAEELEEAVQYEAVCSGVLARVAYRLAGRAAVFARLAEAAGEGGPEGPKADETDDEAPSPDDVDLELPGLPAEGARERLAELARLDRAFRRVRAELLTAEAMEARIRTHQTDWTRVACRVLVLESEDVAREALISVREDGADLAEVASDAGVELNETTYFLEELETGLRDRLLAAQKGEILGPLRVGEGFAIFHVLDKVIPSPEDEEVAARAERSLVGSLVAREVDDRVTWLFRL